jgi:hypothetical protein
MNTLMQPMTKERQAMNYNINVIKFVWRQLRKPSRVTLDAITIASPNLGVGMSQFSRVSLV